MPIDDELERIGEGVKEGTSREETFESTGRLEDDATRVMGEFLVQYFNGELVGQKEVPKMEDLYLDAVRRSGITIMNITPEISTSCRGLDTSLPGLIERDLVEVLKILCGDYILETDLVGLAKDRPEELAKYVHELYEFKRKVTGDLVTRINTGICRATLHPHLFVMGMDKTHRPLATLSVNRAIEKGDISLLKTAPEETGRLNNNILRGILNCMSIPMRDCLEVAKEYGVKELIPVIEDYNKARKMYINVWGKD